MNRLSTSEIEEKNQTVKKNKKALKWTCGFCLLCSSSKRNKQNVGNVGESFNIQNSLLDKNNLIQEKISEPNSSGPPDEPFAIHFVETSENYENMEIEDENPCEPIGFKSSSENNYLSCVIQMLYSCRKLVKEILDYGIHMSDMQSPKNYFSIKMRETFQGLEDKRKSDAQRCLTIVQSGLSDYPFTRSLSACFLSIFLKIENETVMEDESPSHVKEESIMEMSNDFEQFFVENFYSRIALSLICDDCGESLSRSVQYLRMLPLTIKNPYIPTVIADEINEIFNDMDVYDKERECNCGRGDHKFIRRTTLVRGPEYLIVCLENPEEWIIKKENLICDREINITVCKEKVKYQLIAVIDQIRDGKHCFCKCLFNEEKGNWWLFNDEIVTKIGENYLPKIVTENSIAFIFKKD